MGSPKTFWIALWGLLPDALGTSLYFNQDYQTNDNDQAVVEICITRITTAIRETESIEKHGKALVALWESCLEHNLKPSGKDEDTPHAKIASDIMSCILQHSLNFPDWRPCNGLSSLSVCSVGSCVPLSKCFRDCSVTDYFEKGVHSNEMRKS
uniref:Uncharacterized protein n=1 Tax=Pavo cristatus TaxID=9049 RepID=A0A8C9FT02_PAVCR